jgi:hypothetical protein
LGTVVDALQRGLELGVVALDLAQEPERVLLLTGHPGEVVEDDIGRFERRERGQHVLKRRALQVRAGASKLHELRHHTRPETLGMTHA